MPPSDAGLLTAVLDAVARRDSLVPDDWTNVISFVSLRPPDRFDRDAFERLRSMMKADYGLELTVVGGAYGCFKLFVRVEHSLDGKATTVEVDSNTQPDPDLLGTVLRQIMNSPSLRKELAESGIAKVQTREVTYDVRTEQRSPGHGGDRPIIIVNGPVGSIGNENTISDTDISAGQERPPAARDSRKPGPGM
ncbi:hypothetical protein SAMN05446635_5302 [Burkholderia sp. OK233]|nr:hypothetical protein SAMN05446635_5302 [Burkholderia sp. OK233]